MTSQQRPASIDWEVLSRIVGRDPALRRRLLRLFIEDTESDLLAIKAAVQAGDHETARLLAHRVSGAAKTIGATPLAKAGSALERVQTYPDKVALTHSLIELEAAVSATFSAIRDDEGADPSMV